MSKRWFSSIKNSKLAMLGMVLAVSVIGAGIITATKPGNASAAANCDAVNIIKCGLSGSGLNGYINSFKSEYMSNSDNGHRDLKSTYHWAGATGTAVKNMSSANTKLGTLYANGDIKVDGKLVGQDASVTARFSNGSGFTEISNGVWARKTTTSFAEGSAKVIVHYGSDGNADFAIMVDCGNGVKFTPTPQPKPSMSCVSLVASATGNLRNYTFTVRGEANNTDIEKYVIDFGDGTSATLATSHTKASVSHTYAEEGKSYRAMATVYSSIGQNTSNGCATTITPPSTASLTCTSLTQQQDVNQKLTYKFVATASSKNTAINNYVFTYSDGTQDTITTNATTASAAHTFPKNDTAYVTSVAVNGNVTSEACKASVTTPKQEECKPGVPVGSKECDTPVPPTTPPETPTRLVNTGSSAGTLFGIFTFVTIGAMAIHRYLTRVRWYYLG